MNQRSAQSSLPYILPIYRVNSVKVNNKQSPLRNRKTVLAARYIFNCKIIFLARRGECTNNPGNSFDAYISFGQILYTEDIHTSQIFGSLKLNKIIQSKSERKFLETFQGEFIYSASKWLRADWICFRIFSLSQSVSASSQKPAASRQSPPVGRYNICQIQIHRIAKVLRMWPPAFCLRPALCTSFQIQMLELPRFWRHGL